MLLFYFGRYERWLQTFNLSGLNDLLSFGVCIVSLTPSQFLKQYRGTRN